MSYKSYQGPDNSKCYICKDFARSCCDICEKPMCLYHRVYIDARDCNAGIETTACTRCLID